VAVFMPAWIVASVSQPLSAVAFVTDGIHWGTGDYRYMRNGMLLATLIACVSLFLIDTTANNALVYVWLGTVLWIALRSIWGIVRVFPGVGDAPIGAEKVQANPA
ncbi:MAG: MATE family efflux transporter, partial [Chloroflexota bacterium]